MQQLSGPSYADDAIENHGFVTLEGKFTLEALIFLSLLPKVRILEVSAFQFMWFVKCLKKLSKFFRVAMEFPDGKFDVEVSKPERLLLVVIQHMRWKHSWVFSCITVFSKTWLGYKSFFFLILLQCIDKRLRSLCSVVGPGCWLTDASP